MTVTDPREEYDDLVVWRSREVLGSERFEEAATSEAATVGWVVLGFAFDDADRVLLIEQPWADGCLAPGGILDPGESFPETVVRELEEETGVRVSPVRPHAVDEFTFVNERTGETGGWTSVTFEATAETTDINVDPGLDDETILDADWFECLPEHVFRPEFTETVYRRCLDNRASR